MEGMVSEIINKLDKIDTVAAMDVEEAKRHITQFLAQRKQFALMYRSRNWKKHEEESLLAGIDFCNEQISKILAL